LIPSGDIISLIAPLRQSSISQKRYIMTFKKLPPRYIGIVQPLIISIIMSCVVSGIATLRSIGLSDDFLHTWMTAWPMSWAVAFPVLLFVLPTARKIAHLFVEK
jgi:Protein of unknown function (DUF2798)